MNGSLKTVLAILTIVAIAIILMDVYGCHNPAYIRFPRRECMSYVLKDGRTVVVWISEAPKAAKGLPTVWDYGIRGVIDPREFE